jgi:CubicO group peptidase (beta-lactamase class C family)
MQRAAFHSAWVLDDTPATGAGAMLDTFPWWSFTKTVLAIAALRLGEVGKLELDAPLPR